MPDETTWIVIQDEDLDDYLVGAQMDALRSAALATGQDNPFDRVMPDVAARIRAEVRACRSNQVSALPNSIPPDLKTYACYLIIEAMTVRLSIGISLTDDQRTQCSEARKYLRRIADCEIPIAQPTEPEPSDTVQQHGGMIESVGDRPIRTSRDQTSRL
jgi:hypothetical protein